MRGVFQNMATRMEMMSLIRGAGRCVLDLRMSGEAANPSTNSVLIDSATHLRAIP